MEMALKVRCKTTFPNRPYLIGGGAEEQGRAYPQDGGDGSLAGVQTD